MNWLRRIGFALVQRAKRTPYFHLPGYMERYWLVPYAHPVEVRGTLHGTGPVTWRRPVAKLLQACGVAVRVHHILRSDDGRAFHDHPWPYLTIVLAGGYTEVRPHYNDSGIYVCDVRCWHGPGSVLYRPADSWHRLELPGGATAWTVFFTGPKRQTWGFLRDPANKVAYYTYEGKP